MILPRTRQYLGTWTLPSGNSANVYLEPKPALTAEWDEPPSPAWPAADVEHYRNVTFPEIMRAVAHVLGGPVLGITP